MLIHNHLNISGPIHDIDAVATAFMNGTPFNDIFRLPPLERQTVEAIESQRLRAWGTPHEAFRPRILDVFDMSVAVEF